MKNLIAIGVLVVLGVVALVVFREPPEDDSKAKLAEAIKPVSLDKLDTIKIKRHEGVGDKRKVETYTLKKKGGAWRMAEPVDYEVVASSMESMTKALSEFRVVDVISEKPGSHADLKVDDKEGIEVTALSGKETLAHVILGSTRNGFTFARLPKQNTVYRLKGSFRYNFDKAARLLRNKEIIKLPFEDIKQVTFENGEEKLVFAVEGEKGSEVVKPVDVEIENFDESKAKGIIRSITNLNAIDFQDEAAPDEKTGLGAEAVKITTTATKDEKPFEVTLLIGKEDPELKKTFAKVSGKDQIFLISTYTAKRLRSKKADYARTDEDMEKEKKKAEEAKKKGPPPGMGGPGMGGPGGMQITPEMLQQMQH